MTIGKAAAATRKKVVSAGRFVAAMIQRGTGRIINIK